MAGALSLGEIGSTHAMAVIRCSTTLRWSCTSLVTGCMNREHVLSVLYDLTLTVGGEVRLEAPCSPGCCNA